MPLVTRIPPMTALIDSATNEIRTGLPVRGESQWYQMAQQANWLLTAGSSLVVAGPEGDQLGVGSNYSFKYYAWPHSQNVWRLWVIGMGGDDDGATGTLKNIGATETLATWSVPSRNPGEQHDTPIVVYGLEYVASPSTGQIGFRVDVDADSPGWAKVQSVGCYEMPVPWVAQDDHPDTFLPDENKLRGGEIIYDDEADQLVGPASVAITVPTIANDARRACLASFWRLTPLHRTAASFSNMFGESYLPVLARRRYFADGAGNRTIAIAAYLEGTGECKVSASSGDSHTFTVSGSTGAWVTSTLDIDAEDLDSLPTNGGLQSSTRDKITIELKGDGAGGIYINGFCAGETD